jgi:hypothetical protein
MHIQQRPARPRGSNQQTRAEAEHLRAPSEVEATVRDERQRATLEAKRERIIDAYVDDKISKADRDTRLTAIDAEFASLDQRRVVLAVPPIGDIDWEDPAKVNTVLKALFERVELDAKTFEPIGFTWRVPEWRTRDTTTTSRLPVRSAPSATKQIENAWTGPIAQGMHDRCWAMRYGLNPEGYVQDQRRDREQPSVHVLTVAERDR